MKPPVESVKISSKGRNALIQAKRETGLAQWNELLRWAFCLSLKDPAKPGQIHKFDSGIDPVEWKTFAGSLDQVFAALFYHRASQDGIDLDDNEAVADYFRVHIERGVSSLRTFKSLHSLIVIDSDSN